MTRKLVISLLVLGLAGTFALAGEDSYGFVGAGIGYSSTDLDISTQNFQDNATAWKVFGGFRAMKFFSTEVGYIDFGSLSDQLDFGTGSEQVEVSTTGYDVELVGTIPLGSFIEIYGKGGYLWWDSKATAGSFSDSTSGSDWVYGAGVQLVIAKKVGFRLEYEKYEIEDTNSVYLMTLGAEWRF